MSSAPFLVILSFNLNLTLASNCSGWCALRSAKSHARHLSYVSNLQEKRLRPASIPQWSYSVQELVDRINTSFGDIPRPAITPHVARAYDDEYTVSMDRGLELTKLDPEQHWRDVPDHSIEKFREYFCFSDDEGWRFYMPAYLLHALRRLPHSHDFPVYHACKNLDCVSLMTDSQLSCLIDFAKLCEACGHEQGS